MPDAFSEVVELEERHRNAVRPGLALGVLQLNFPVIRERATVEYLESRPWGLVEEFVATCIVRLQEVRGAEEIAEILGFGDPCFIEPSVKELMARNLVVQEEGGCLRATPELQESFRRREWLTPRTVDVACDLDTCTGMRSPPDPGLSDREALQEVERDPRDADALLQWAASPSGPLTGRHLRRLIRHHRLLVGYYGYEVVVFAEPLKGAWNWVPLVPGTGEQAPHLVGACLQAGVEAEAEKLLEGVAERLHVEETNKPQQEADAFPTAAALPPAEKQHDLREEHYETTEARERIIELISEAREEVFAVFPWIKGPAIDSRLLEAYRRATSRGASVFVLYGFLDDPEDEDSHQPAIDRLRAIQNSGTGARVHVVWHGRHHTKLLVVDREHYMSGSLNALSYLGDPGRPGFRLEVMDYLYRPRFLRSQVLARLVPIARRGILEDVSKTPARSYSEWLLCWRDLLRLGTDQATLKAALASVPGGISPAVRAATLALEGISRDLSDEPMGPRLEWLIGWLGQRRKEKPTEPLKKGEVQKLLRAGECLVPAAEGSEELVAGLREALGR